MALTTNGGQDFEGGGNPFVSLTSNLSAKQQEIFDTCLNQLRGLSVKESEQILFELLSSIKTFALIAV